MTLSGTDPAKAVSLHAEGSPAPSDSTGLVSHSHLLSGALTPGSLHLHLHSNHWLIHPCPHCLAFAHAFSSTRRPTCPPASPPGPKPPSGSPPTALAVSTCCHWGLCPPLRSGALLARGGRKTSGGDWALASSQLGSLSQALVLAASSSQTQGRGSLPHGSLKWNREDHVHL